MSYKATQVTTSIDPTGMVSGDDTVYHFEGVTAPPHASFMLYSCNVQLDLAVTVVLSVLADDVVLEALITIGETDTGRCKVTYLLPVTPGVVYAVNILNTLGLPSTITSGCITQRFI